MDIIPSTSPLALAIISCFSGGIIISPKLNDKPPSNAKENPIDLILSKNSAVSGTLVNFKISPIISRNDFFVNTSLIKPAFSGTTWLNKTRPTVVSIILKTKFPDSSKSFALILITAFKSTLSSL